MVFRYFCCINLVSLGRASSCQFFLDYELFSKTSLAVFVPISFLRQLLDKEKTVD